MNPWLSLIDNDAPAKQFKSNELNENATEVANEKLTPGIEKISRSHL
jgi:hypothetical protein